MSGKESGEMQTLLDLADRIREFGDRPAAIRYTRDGADEWSFERLAKVAGRLAGGLRDAGAEKGEKIAIIAEPTPEWFAVALGVLRVGAVLVPVDTQMSDKNLKQVFNDSGACRVFATNRTAHRIRAVRKEDPLEIFVLEEPDEKAKEGGNKEWKDLLADESFTAEGIAAEDDAILFYTSGTTGPPKGVPLTHRNIAYQIRVIKETGLVNDEDRMLLPLPLHHVYPLVIGVLTPLALGVAILIPHALTGEGIARALREGNGSVILGVPRLYKALFEGIRAKLGAAGRIATGLFAGALALSRWAQRIHLPLGRLLFRPIRNNMGPKVRILASGGSPLDPVLAQNLEALGWPVAVGYGLTETSPLLTIKFPGEGHHASVGRAIEGVELRIDPGGLPEGERKQQEAGKTEHERGEVLARGPNVFKGYHNLPEKTEKSLTDGWFHTGDLGFIEDGFLYLGGRASSMIVLQGGENINPEDLEEIYGEANEVAEIGILEDDGKLAALVVPDRSVQREHSGEDLEKTIKKALDRQASGLASYKRLSRVEIAREPLPTTNLGKIKRHLLQERYEAAKKGEDGERRKTGPIPVERMDSQDQALLDDPRAGKLWDLLSKRYKDRRLTPDAHLELDLGIDSLEWVELSISAQERAQVPIAEDIIERVETVRDLLEEAAQAESVEAPQARKPIEKPENVLKESEKKWATPRGPVSTLVAATLFGLLSGLLKLRCRIQARGLDRLPNEGPFIVVPNHVSFLDAPALSVALGYKRAKHLYWAGRGEILFTSPLRRGISRLAQIFPVDPKRGPMSSLAVSALLIKRGRALVWFPEGGISKDGRLQDFQPGIGLIVDHYAPPIIPVHIEGTRDVLPLGKKFPGAGEITIHIGKPIDRERLKAAAKKTGDGEIHHRIAKALHRELKQLADTIRRESSKPDEKKAA